MKDYIVEEFERPLTGDELSDYAQNSISFITFAYDSKRNIYVYVFENETQNTSTPRLAENTSKFIPKRALIALGINPQTAADYLTIRQAKKRPLTQTAFVRLANQIKLATEHYGITANDVMTIVVDRGWESFSNDWLENVDFANYGLQKQSNNMFADNNNIKWE